LKQLAIEQPFPQLGSNLLSGIVFAVELAAINMLAPLCVSPHCSKHSHRVDVQSLRNLSVRHLLFLLELDDVLDVNRADLSVVAPAFGLLLDLSLLRRGTYLFETLAQCSKIFGQHSSFLRLLEI
jgi:hypothetical protein